MGKSTSKRAAISNTLRQPSPICLIDFTRTSHLMPDQPTRPDSWSPSSYDRIVNNSKRSFREMLSRASLGDVLRVARKASRSVRLSRALSRQRDAWQADEKG